MNDIFKDKRCKETLKYSKMNITAKCDSIFNGNIQKNAFLSSGNHPLDIDKFDSCSAEEGSSRDF